MKTSTARRIPLGIVVAAMLAACRPTPHADNREFAWTAPHPIAPAGYTRMEGRDGGTAAMAASNSRDLGDPGFRRVKLELRDGHQVTDRYEIVNVWRRFGSELRVFYFLDEPANLRGTAFLVVEGKRMDVAFHLPAGDGAVRRLDPTNWAEELLGSDFNYYDLRFTFPMDNVRWATLGRAEIDGHARVLLSAEPEDAASQYDWSHALLSLEEDSGLVREIDYYGAEPGRHGPSKRLRTVSRERRDGVWTPTQILAYQRGDQNSVLTLLASDFRFERGRELRFVPDELPGLGAWLASAVDRRTGRPGHRAMAVPDGR